MMTILKISLKFIICIYPSSHRLFPRRVHHCHPLERTDFLFHFGCCYIHHHKWFLFFSNMQEGCISLHYEESWAKIALYHTHPPTPTAIPKGFINYTCVVNNNKTNTAAQSNSQLGSLEATKAFSSLAPANIQRSASSLARRRALSILGATPLNTTSFLVFQMVACSSQMVSNLRCHRQLLN